MSDAASTFVVEGEFSIYQAAEIAQALQAWWPHAEASGAVRLDLSEVSEMDSAGLQLLLSAQRSAQAQALGFQIVSASESVVQTLELCALQQCLPRPLRTEQAP